MPEPVRCEAATCRDKKPAVIQVSGVVEDPAGIKISKTLNVCAECAGPILKKEKPVIMGAKCPP
jgi:hypothetical protein